MATTQEQKYQHEDKGVIWEHNDQHKKEEGYSLKTRKLMQKGKV